MLDDRAPLVVCFPLEIGRVPRMSKGFFESDDACAQVIAFEGNRGSFLRTVPTARRG
jgi:hypothetical protein